MTSLNVKPVFATIAFGAFVMVLSACHGREIYEETRTVEYGDGSSTVYRTDPVTTVYRTEPVSVVTTTSDYGNCGCNGAMSQRDILSEIQRLNNKVDKIYNEVKTLGYE